MLQRFLDPATLPPFRGWTSSPRRWSTASSPACIGRRISGSRQEFAEYRAYAEGDDLRHVDWNVFARTDKCFLKRYRGETNSQLLILLDTSASMGYGSHEVTKLDYARFVAASLCYMANLQRDAAGLIIFDEDVEELRGAFHPAGPALPPAARHRESRARHPHRFRQAIRSFPEFLHRRGIVVVLSDFYEHPETSSARWNRCAITATRSILFHVLDPQEIKPKFREPVLLVDMENAAEAMEVSPEYARNEYRQQDRCAHRESAQQGARRGPGLFPDGHRPPAR